MPTLPRWNRLDVPFRVYYNLAAAQPGLGSGAQIGVFDRRRLSLSPDVVMERMPDGVRSSELRRQLSFLHLLFLNRYFGEEGLNEVAAAERPSSSLGRVRR